MSNETYRDYEARRAEHARRQRRNRRRQRRRALLRLFVLLIILGAVWHVAGPVIMEDTGGVSSASAEDVGFQLPSKWPEIPVLRNVEEFFIGLVEKFTGAAESDSSSDANTEGAGAAQGQESLPAGDPSDAAGSADGTAAAGAEESSAETGDIDAVMTSLASGPYYFYHHLSGEDQEIYARVYRGVLAMEEDITLSTTDYEHVYVIEDLMLADHPELFWYEGEGKSTQYTFKLVLHPTYTVGAEEVAAREGKIAAETAEFLARIGENETTYERVATAFNFVADHCSYVTGAPDDQNICSSLINHESVCAGYAKGMQYLLQQLGIECLYVWGNVTDRGDHAWNIVNIDGTYYQSDVTFGDRSFSDGTAEEHGLPDALSKEYGYMCMNDEDALRDRTFGMELPEGVSLPACESTEMSYYHRHDWYYPEYSEAVWDDMEQSLSEGVTYWRYQFGTEEAYEEFLEEISDNRFARLGLEMLGLSSIKTYTSPNDVLYVVAGWVP